VHIPDGYLGPQTYAVLDAAILPVWFVAARRVRKTLTTKQVPLLALGAAFAFVIMMFNVPMVGGSTGHAIGATLVAIVLGPWAACISVSIAVVIQALVFGDGGITALGANVLNMAVIAPFVGYAAYRLIAGRKPGDRRLVAAAGLGAYTGIVVGSIAAGIEFGLQPLLAHTASGQPLYAPYPLGVAVPAMALGHLLFFGPLEAVVTMGVVAALAKASPEMLRAASPARSLRWLWVAVGALLILTPLGALASGTAWGEWTTGQLRASLGFVPAGLRSLEGAWTGLMPGYAAPGIAASSGTYLLAAIVGAAAVVAVGAGLGAVLTRRRSLARRTADAITRAVSDVLRNDSTASAPGLLQRLDPRVKLVSLVAFAVTASLARSPWVLAALFAGTLLIAAASRVSVASFLQRVLGSAGVFALIVAAPAATGLVTPGAAVATLGPLTLTAPGLAGATTLVLRVVAGAGFALLTVWTMRWTDILHALQAFRLPALVVATLATTQQQLLVLLRIVEQTHLARESRSVALGSTARDRSWVTDRLAFVARKSLKTADDVHDAMLSRGFDGSLRPLSRLRASAADGWWAAGAASACTLLLLLDRLVVLK
jgi:cobalt/nickel transport system permease protein